MQLEFLAVKEGTDGRYYVVENGKVIYTTRNMEDAWEYLGHYESFLQEQEFSRMYPGTL